MKNNGHTVDNELQDFLRTEAQESISKYNRVGFFSNLSAFPVLHQNQTLDIILYSFYNVLKL